MPAVFAVDEEVLFHIDKERIMSRIAASTLLLFVVLSSLTAKDNPFQIVTWPDSGRPVLRFTFSNTIAENLSDKTIGTANFSLYVLDKDKARIGEGCINLTNIGAGQTVKIPNNAVCIRKSYVRGRVHDCPAPGVNHSEFRSAQGAVLKGDGKVAGTTPKIVDVAIGTRLNSAKRVSIQGSSRLKLLRVMRPAEVSATNWGQPCARHHRVTGRVGSIWRPGFDQRYASSGTHRWEYSNI
jgi:hypothetical protein